MAFSGVKRSGGDFNGKLNFDFAKVNLGSSLDPTSGEFTAPHAGHYYFSLSGVTGTTKGETTISVIKNNRNMYINEGNVKSGQNSVSYAWVEAMESGDKLSMTVTSNNLYADEENQVVLNGFSIVSISSILSLSSLSTFRTLAHPYT